MRVVIVGVYNSGIELVSALLSELGVHFGQTPEECRLDRLLLNRRIRQWWNEPQLVASISSIQRPMQLTQWVETLERTAHLVGAADPLLSLCLNDIKSAWGPETLYIWCRRTNASVNIFSSDDSLQRAECLHIQATLNDALDQFFSTEPFLALDMDHLGEDLERQVMNIAVYLGLQLPSEKLDEAVQRIRRVCDLSDDQESLLAPMSHVNVVDRVSVARPPGHPKIVATILAGNSQSIIEPAIRSALEWVDEICLINTGITDGTLEKAQQVGGAKLSIHSFPWCHDFAAARNAAVQFAAETNATWALTLDTDERLVFAGYRDKQHLLNSLECNPEVNLWLVAASDGSYVKERFIRVPTQLQWKGQTHEALDGTTPTGRAVLWGCSFWEEAKSTEQLDYKLRRDLDILVRETANQPLAARWWFYLGQTYEGMKEYRRAVQAFDRCIRIDGWKDESSWACYLAARCLVAIKEFREAEEYCGLGLSRQPSRAEFPWLAGWCCFKRGAIRDSITWSRWAIALGQSNAAFDECIFRHLPAWFEAPHDVLRYAYNRLNESKLSEQADADFQNALSARLKYLEDGIRRNFSPVQLAF